MKHDLDSYLWTPRDFKAFFDLMMLMACLLTDRHYFRARKDVPVQRKSQSTHEGQRRDFMGQLSRSRAQGRKKTYSVNPKPPERMLSQTESLWQAPHLCLSSLRNVLVKVKHVNSEREQ